MLHCRIGQSPPDESPHKGEKQLRARDAHYPMQQLTGQLVTKRIDKEERGRRIATQVLQPPHKVVEGFLEVALNHVNHNASRTGTNTIYICLKGCRIIVVTFHEYEVNSTLRQYLISKSVAQECF
jgi:hypothetical protein